MPFLGNGQKAVSGTIKEENNLKVIPNAMVLVKNDSSQILDYASTDSLGNFQFAIDNLNTIIIEVSSLGFKKKTDTLYFDDGTNEIEIDFLLSENVEQLKEVVVRAERPMIVSKDTITFRVQQYAQGTEHTVEDILKKIPGLQIDSEGTIKVGNTEIEKLLVDGDDLFDKGYKVLSRNMPAYAIGEVEILRRYSENHLLKGVEESDRVALNLKLDEKSKRVWFGNTEISVGNDSFYQIKGNLMNFGKKNKYYFLANFNSIGQDATGDIESLIRPIRNGDRPGGVGDNETANGLIDLSGNNNLAFKRSRTNFNNAELASLNAIFNPSEKFKIKTLGFFNWDETGFFRNTIDNVNTNNANFTNSEDYTLSNKKRIAYGKLDFIFNVSKIKMLEATTKYNNSNFNDASNLLFNGSSTIENLQHQNTLFDQKIGYTNKFKDKKVFLLTGRFISEKVPQNYRINQFFYQDLFPETIDADNVSQLSENQMQFAGINAHLLDRKENGHLMEVQIGNEFRKDKLFTSFSIMEGNETISQPNGYQNQTSYRVNNLYLKSKYRLEVDDFGIIGKLNVHQLFNRLGNNLNVSNQKPFFVNPKIGLDWKINDKNKIVSSYSYNTTNAEVLDVYSDFMLTNFRSFTKGTGGFNQLDVSSVVFNYILGNWTDRLFANASLLYNKNHDFISTNTFIEQNYTQTEKVLIKDRKFISVTSNMDYYVRSISSNVKIALGYTKSEFKNIVNNSGFREVESTNYNYGLELRSSFNGVFNYHIGTKWGTTEIKTTVDNSFTDNMSFLDLSFVLDDTFNFKIQTERYFFGSLRTNNTYYFMDFDTDYKLKKKKINLGITGKNLFNTERFRSFIVSDIGTSTTEYRLLPRFVLLKIEYRF